MAILYRCIDAGFGTFMYMELYWYMKLLEEINQWWVSGLIACMKEPKIP